MWTGKVRSSATWWFHSGPENLCVAHVLPKLAPGTLPLPPPSDQALRNTFSVSVLPFFNVQIVIAEGVSWSLLAQIIMEGQLTLEEDSHI